MTRRSRIRVGIVGASTNPFAWASTAHVPALKALTDFELVAVASRNQANADAAAALHGIADAYGDYREMIARPDIDMICVSTSAEHHLPLVMPAIEAGKHVFCEWPFGTDIDQATKMRDAAASRGVRTLIGLQTRYSAAVAYVRDLISQDYVGPIWSVGLRRANDQAAQMELTPEFLKMLEQSDAGLRIMSGHALDTLAAYVGEFVELQAYSATQMNKVRLTTGDTGSLTIEDHFLIQGRLSGGALATALIKMNSPAYKSFELEISGPKGAIVVSGIDPDPTQRQPGLPFDFELTGTPALGQPFETIAIPEPYTRDADAVPSGAATDVARMYRHFAAALKSGTRCETDFDHGIMRHRLLAAIETASADDRRQTFRP
jgi:predicted dehydrogenase